MPCHLSSCQCVLRNILQASLPKREFLFVSFLIVPMKLHIPVSKYVIEHNFSVRSGIFAFLLPGLKIKKYLFPNSKINVHA
jgi:hypothetical protein